MFPKVTDVAPLLKDLISRKVSAKESKPPWKVDGNWKGILTEFVLADQTLAAVLVVDVPFACYTGAALTMVPAGVANEGVKKGAVTDALRENYDEVANVLTALYRPYGRRMIRGRSFARMAEVPPEVMAILEKPALKLLVETEIDGYGSGKMALFDK